MTGLLRCPTCHVTQSLGAGAVVDEWATCFACWERLRVVTVERPLPADDRFLLTGPGAA